MENANGITHDESQSALAKRAPGRGILLEMPNVTPMGELRVSALAKGAPGRGILREIPTALPMGRVIGAGEDECPVFCGRRIDEFDRLLPWWGITNSRFVK